jgi:type IV pilus assembly protein PilB
MLNEQQLKSILLDNKILSEEDFKKIAQEAKENGKNLEIYLEEKRIIEEKGLYEKAANFFNVPFVNLKDITIKKEALFSIPEPIAIAHSIIAFDLVEKNLSLAVLDPEDLEIFEFIRKKTGYDLKINLTAPEIINDSLKQYRQSSKTELSSFTEQGAGDDKISFSAEKEENLENLAKDLPIVSIVNDLLEYALFKDASDIHIEPEEKDVIVRYRIDGILNPVMTLEKSVHPGIVARIKILSNLKVDEHRLPQDGRFKLNSEKYHVSFRVSIIPAFDGEKIVIRLLNERAQILSLESLGFQPDSLETVKRNISKPHGMLLVTGPTGSGKTTTLYTILSILNTPRVNISTIEDPIEYRMPHVNQSQINSKIGFTFDSGLRALLRQDPNIIMVGEIRDEETAKTAVHAAMTGHLLLSTLHTNDAATTLPRLSQMGIPAFLIASTTNLIISQRLVRKICPFCKESYKLSKITLEDLEKQLDISGLLNKLEKVGAIKSSKGGVETISFYRGKGCKKCNNTGYKGRIGVYEVLEMTPIISDLILKNCDAGEIEKEAIKQGMLKLVEDGVIKAVNGVTSIEEVLRVTKE